MFLTEGPSLGENGLCILGGVVMAWLPGVTAPGLGASDAFSEMYFRSRDWRRDAGRLLRVLISLRPDEFPLIEERLCWVRCRLM